MAILDFATHDKHISYTLALAAGGFAYTDSSYDDGQTLFGLVDFGPLPATVLVSTALLFFLAAMLTGVFSLFALSGINQLSAKKGALEATIESERMVRLVYPNESPDTEIAARKDLKSTTKKIQHFTTRLEKRSERHLWYLAAGFVLSALLFADSKFDPDPPTARCQLEVNTSGALTLPISCVP